MTGSDAALLAALPHLAFAFMLLLARIGALIMLAPGLGESEVPAVLRAALAVSVTALLLPVLGDTMPQPPADMLRCASLIGAELITGIWFGWLARLVALALPLAAQIGSFMVGLSNVLVPDFSGGDQTSSLSRLFGLVPPLLILASGLYMLPLSALVASYHLIPPGAMLPVGDAANLVVRGVTASFALAVRLVGPFLIAHTVWQVTLGIVSRMAPALHIQVLSMPGQVLGGLALLALTAPTMLAAWFIALHAGLVPAG